MISTMLAQLFLSTGLLALFPVDNTQLAAVANVTPLPFGQAFSYTATTATPSDGPVKNDPDSYGIIVNAKSAIVVDATSGAVLFAKDADMPRAIGSITKAMAILVFFDTQPDLSQQVKVISDDYIAGGRVYLRFDDALALRDVVKAALVGSDNTATAALARLSGLSREDFVAAMNAKAAALGMTHSSFVDPSGVENNNRSTARDLSMLLAAVEDNATMAADMKLSQVTVTQSSGYSVDIAATDELLTSFLNEGSYRVVVGKTGYIPQAGYCLASSIEHNGHRLRLVALGASNIEARFHDVKGLAYWAFTTFVWPQQ